MEIYPMLLNFIIFNLNFVRLGLSEIGLDHTGPDYRPLGYF
jgi:hypothetical protein